MKKTRLLSLALVVAVLLMGAGYALWSEALRIDGEICTGELDFALDGEYLSSHCYAEGSFVVDEDGHTAVLSLSNMSPGEESKFEICIENTGTIGIVVEDFTVTGTNDALNQITIGSKSVEDYFTDMFAGKVLEPGEGFCEEVVFYVDWEADEDTFPEDICFDLLIEANVTQSCYEDYGNGGGDPDPEPECPTGLIFDGTVAKGCGWDYYANGDLYFVFADGSTEFAGTITNLLIPWGGETISRTYGDCGEYSITITRF